MTTKTDLVIGSCVICGGPLYALRADDGDTVGYCEHHCPERVMRAKNSAVNRETDHGGPDSDPPPFAKVQAWENYIDDDGTTSPHWAKRWPGIF